MKKVPGLLLPLSFITLILGFYACGPSAEELEAVAAAQARADSLNKALKVSVPPGFVVEHLHNPTDSNNYQGSWVAMAKDDSGRLITSDQYGNLYRVSVPPIGVDSPFAEVEKLPLEIGCAQGLLWAFHSLYVVVNASEKQGISGRGSGLYRITDENGDGELDSVHTLKQLTGNGEHGPHSIVAAPDGKSLYVIGGNHTELPEGYRSLIPTNWAEDQLFPGIKDPRGHAVGRKAPGGWVAKIDPLGKRWELVSVGYRNPFDLTFNAQGELFIFDSDMEWDMGMPWYRPIRVCHVTSGSEYGWRTGSAKWPEYYPDNLPSVVDIGQGSPTSIFMGYGAKFPARYQKGLFISDWSFGTMYFVDLTPNGSSYTGKKEEFLSGVPLPLTDALIGEDGAMYFMTGGRRLESDLYRVYYKGDEDTAPVDFQSDPSDGDRATRIALEHYHGKQDPDAVEAVWPYLNHADRYVRYAARVALEHQPHRQWRQKLEKETDPVRLIQASIAFARQGPASYRNTLAKGLEKIDYAALSPEQQLDVIRAYGLIFTRMGKPDARNRNYIIQLLDDHFPANSDAHNREICQLMAYLNAPTVVDKTLALIEKGSDAGQAGPILADSVVQRSKQYGKDIANMVAKMPPAQEIAYVNYLSHVTNGWTTASRRKYFQWFLDATGKSGGRSYRGFLDYMRYQATQRIPVRERRQLADLTGQFEAQRTRALASIPRAQGPGKSWNKREVGGLFRQVGKTQHNFRRGKRMFAASMCATCHTMQGEGGNIGPDLTQVPTKFSNKDILETILSPSASISDQYAATIFTLKDGSTQLGRKVGETDTEIQINQNPYDPAQRLSIAKADIASEALSPVSIMPPGLINRLNEKELLDLLAYLMAGGDAEHKVYVGESEDENEEKNAP